MMRWIPGLSFIILLAACLNVVQADDQQGVLPKQNGRLLNLDFETGDLRDWTVEGEAFVGQPIEGDTVYPRRNDNKSQHQGRFWIGGFEKIGDTPRGKLISVPFQVTHPWASFLVGGGPHLETCVELVDHARNEVIFRVSGLEEENLRRVAVDLQKHVGKTIFIRLIDNHTGHWGHLNFDDFRFHNAKPTVPPRPQAKLENDNYPHAGLSPEESVKAMTVPEGFSVKLFAGEPDVRQPIAFCMDDRGRLWVAEAYCYPQRRKDGEGKDRILIMEDTNNDGKFDKSIVFADKLNLVSGIEWGFGGLWVGAAPYLMFIPIDASGDKPAGEPKILLDGWGWQDTHETLNTFSWGPDGWLYGCHGVFTHSKVGKPGAADNERTKINAGIWRYHPIRHQFEVFAWGTSNPWGLDYNAQGQLFIEACVIPHCFHIIQNGRYLRQAGSHFNPHTYADIGTIADHFHYLGAIPHSGNNKSDSAGGGHAHCGLMCYLGGTWPKEYHGQLFMGNIHGRRLNMDRLKTNGSGYVASHGPDFLLANDAWARFINMQYGPDGNVFLIDWYDQQACHRTEPHIWDRSNGRVYKIVHRSTENRQADLQKLGGDLSKLDNDQLFKLVTHDNHWYVRHARRLLHERSVTQPAGVNRPVSITGNSRIANDWKQEKNADKRLQLLLANHLSQKMPDAEYLSALSDDSDAIRAWGVQLAVEAGHHSTQFIQQFEQMAKLDASAMVRLYLSSALPRLNPSSRWGILANLLQHAEDRDDHNLPLMYWYAAEGLVDTDAPRALKLALDAKVPILEFMVRRISSMNNENAINNLVATLKSSTDVRTQQIILSGINLAMRGLRNVKQPAEWKAVYESLSDKADPEVRHQLLLLGMVFDPDTVMASLSKVVADHSAKLQHRQSGLQALITSRKPEVMQLLMHLSEEEPMRGLAIRGLAVFDQPEIATKLLKSYPQFSSSDRRDAISTLSARPAWSLALLESVKARHIPANDIPADVVRQLRLLNNQQLNSLIAEVWGVVRTTPAERLQHIASMKTMLSSKPKVAADLSLGRALFEKTCAQCHQLYGTGGKVGPDITGSNRANLDYLLENIYDPSSVIPKEYAATFFVTKDGRSITGIVKERNSKTVTVATANETLTLALDDIEGEKPSDTSMMPDDQMKPFSEHEIRSLFAYLMHPTQVPVLAMQENAATFFNGKDLTGWTGDTRLWKVEDGMIVGSTTGLKKNEFLKNQMMVKDFRLSVKVKLTPNTENSGIQFRSEVIDNGDVKGYQADIGKGWWGKLYEEHGRALLTKNNGDQFVKVNHWNDYVIEARGSKIKTFINGNPCVDLDDKPGARQGIIAFQLHSGGPMQIRFKDIKLEVLKD